MGRGAGALEQDRGKVERGATGLLLPVGCGFVLLSLHTGLKEAGNSRKLLHAPWQSLPVAVVGWMGFGARAALHHGPENNWQLHASFGNKNGAKDQPF